jgi:hypothetical protein
MRSNGTSSRFPALIAKSAFCSIAILALGSTPSLGQEYLLIPDSDADVIGKYDAFNGAYQGVWGTVPQTIGTIRTPKSVDLGPDGYVYLSDQVQDRVFRYDQGGVFQGVFADELDGLDNLRGLDFRGNSLFVTMDATNDAVTQFDLTSGARLADFATGTGFDPFDVYFLNDGRALVANIGTSDDIRLYDATGTTFTSIIAPTTSFFPEQIVESISTPGRFLTVGFTSNRLYEFDLAGTIHKNFAFSGPRGIFELGNGNWLVTSGSGVFEVNSTTGAIIENENAAADGQYIERVPEPGTLGLLVLGAALLGRRRHR